MHTACPECGKCVDEDCDGEDEDKCFGHVVIVPELEVEQSEIKLENIDAKVEIKVEVKNVNSFDNIRKTINFEIERQTKLKEAGRYDV